MSTKKEKCLLSSIKEFQLQDEDRVCQIWEEGNRTAHAFIAPTYFEQKKDLVRFFYLAVAKTFVYRIANTTVAFASILENNFIGAFYVDTGYQGIGIGKELMQFLLCKYDDLQLTVYCKNTRAVRFYQSFGFQITNQRQTESGQEEFVMLYHHCRSVKNE